MELLPGVFWGDGAGERLIREGLPAEGNTVMDFHLCAVQEVLNQSWSSVADAGTAVPRSLSNCLSPGDISRCRQEQAGGHLLAGAGGSQLPSTSLSHQRGVEVMAGAASLPAWCHCGQLWGSSCGIRVSQISVGQILVLDFGFC